MGNSQDFRFLTFNGYVSQNSRTATSKVLYDSFYKKYDWAKDVVQKINEAK